MSIPIDWTATFTLAQATAADPASALMMGAPEGAPTGAQTLAPGTAPATAAPAGGGGGFGGFGVLLLPIALLVFLMMMTGGAQRKEKKRQAQMLANLHKHDKVLTIGGMIGTVLEVRSDEIVLKIDENSNSRVRFTKNAIQQVLKAGDGPAITEAEPKVEVRAGKGERATV